MHITDTAAPSAYTAPADCHRAQRESLNELGRVYLEIGLPLASAFEAAMADLRTFDVCKQPRPL